MRIFLPQTLRRSLTNLPLRWVLIVPFVLPMIGAITLIGYLSDRNGQHSVEILADRLVAQTHDRIIQELNSYLQIPILINRLNVDAVDRKWLNSQDVVALDSLLFHRMQQFDGISAVLFASPDQTFRVVERVQDNLYLTSADRLRPNQFKTYRLDIQGKPEKLVNTNNLNLGRDRSWYNRAIKMGQPGWSGIFQHNPSTINLNASQPVYERTTKRLLGVFSVSIQLNYLSDFLNRLSISRFGHVLIIDQNGDLIATAKPEEIYNIKFQKQQVKQLKIYESRDNLTRSLGEYLRDRKWLVKSLNQRENLLFNYQGELQSVSITPYQDRYGLNWRIVTVIPKSHFMKGMKKNTEITILLCLLTLGLAIVIALIATNKLIARFRQLKRASQELAKGNLAQRLPTDNSISELNDVAQAFNQMADQVQQSFQQIKIALEESEKKFTTIFRTSPDPIAIASLKSGRILEINDSLIEFFGYSRDEIIDRTALELNLWHNLDEYNKYRELLKKQLSIRNLETQLRTKSGEVKTVLLSAEIRTLEGQDCVTVLLRDISERKQTEAELRKSESNLLYAQRIAHVGSWELDLKEQKITWSEELFRIFGLDPNQKEPLYNELLKAIPIEEQNILITEIEQALTEHTSYQVEHCICRPDGTIRYVISKGQTEFDDRQQALKLFGTVLDITDRKLAEAAKEESETRFRQLAESVREGFFVYEIESAKYSYVNPAYESILGISMESVGQGMLHWLNQIHPDDRHRIEEGLRRESQGENFNEEYRFIRPNGEINWLRSQAYPIRNQKGNIIRIVGVVEDITEQKKLEQSLRDSEELFRRAFDNAPIGISLVAPNGQFIKTNNYYCNLLGYNQEELLKLKFQDITYPGDLEVDLEGFEQMLSGKISAFQLEKRYITKQGTEIPVLINAALVRDRNGEPLYFIGHIQDIRDRLRVEQMKNEFISVISHELRTPLTSIRGSLGLLNSGVFENRPEKVKRMLQIAMNSSERLERLVNDILTLERLKSHKVQLVKEQCQINDLMQQAIESVQALAEQTGVSISLSALQYSIMVAPDAIVQTLINLLSNAIKFSSSGDTVSLKAEIIEDWQNESPEKWKSDNYAAIPTPFILFTVKDRGRGIPDEKQKIIFEQFQQVDVSDSRNKGGTGLGLAICKKIVQQHNGKIWVESTLGEGSTFYFTLPLQ
ncbi:hypothetical protein NIES2119_12325 [[Phormidium ambiguum] IAM M-71]|uniref:histidine kinase n=1 Tax=[Phormidium ambiguum] IAM M-71 TaxID=454136 RepID=A0A1U7IL68_9CYAN|nr:PAS domain S-box protein [Phormidium ambiguum]OKH37922.1 hypothetical protein NIES2119_12325 [Phormidium ambiguum IAM M-71]